LSIVPYDIFTTLEIAISEVVILKYGVAYHDISTPIFLYPALTQILESAEFRRKRNGENPSLTVASPTQ